MRIWAVVVAAGSGDRFGGPKQYEPLGDARVVDRSILAARAACDAVVLVVPSHRVADAEAEADAVVAGGRTRSASVRAGLAAVPSDADLVVVHDAARPLASTDLFRRVIDVVAAGADAAVPVLPVRDTIKRVEGDAVVATVTRDDLVAVQTPQAFRADVLRAAHAGERDATDDAALVEEFGGKVLTVPGEPWNLKITTPDDLVVARALLGRGG